MSDPLINFVITNWRYVLPFVGGLIFAILGWTRFLETDNKWYLLLLAVGLLLYADSTIRFLVNL